MPSVGLGLGVAFVSSDALLHHTPLRGTDIVLSRMSVEGRMTLCDLTLFPDGETM